MESGALSRDRRGALRRLVAGVIGLALGLWLCVPAAALAVDSTDGVAADVFRNGTEVDVYYRGADNGIWERAYSDAAGWSGADRDPRYRRHRRLLPRRRRISQRDRGRRLLPARRRRHR